MVNRPAMAHWSVVVTVTLAVLAAESAAAEVTRDLPGDGSGLLVLMLPVTSHRAHETLVKTLEDSLQNRLREVSRYRLIRTDQLGGRLDRSDREALLACENVSCSAEIAGTAGIDRIFIASLGRLGEEYILTLTWVDVAHGEPLAIVAENARGDERLLEVTSRALAALMKSTEAEDQRARDFKDNPTRWTGGLSAGFGTRVSPEPYNVGVNVTARLGYGGEWGELGLSFHLLVGGEFSYLAGHTAGAAGRIKYERIQWIPFLELRLGVPVANQRRTRIFVGAGPGFGFEARTAHQGRGLDIHGDNWLTELRAGGGVTHRWGRGHSAFAGYRSRIQFFDRGVDSVSELVESNSTQSETLHHEVEIGWIVHF